MRALVSSSPGLTAAIPRQTLLSLPETAAGSALTVTYYAAKNTTFSGVAETFGGSLGGSALGFRCRRVHRSDSASVYRHAHALELFQKRQRNVRAALERIIEKAGEVDVTASAVVAAVQAYAKINSAGGVD
jgi:hypothetical protein